jgi:hypothetical protein
MNAKISTCEALFESVTQDIRYFEGKPMFRGRSGLSFELDQPTGSAFFVQPLFDQTIGVATSRSRKKELLVLDMAPNRSGESGCLDHKCASIGASWTDFNKFQVGIIYGMDFLVDVAILDETRSWLLLKTLEKIYFFPPDE